MAFALAEALIAAGLTALLVVVVCSFTVFSSRNFAALFNYVSLDDANRLAMDQITRDVRQALSLKSCTTNSTTQKIDSITLVDGDGADLLYSYNRTAGTLTRTKSAKSRVVLKGCESLAFTLGQRNAISNSYGVFPPSSPATCKVIHVTWVCSRRILGQKENTDSVQTARIVIRKQGT